MTHRQFDAMRSLFTLFTLTALAALCVPGVSLADDGGSVGRWYEDEWCICEGEIDQYDDVDRCDVGGPDLVDLASVDATQDGSWCLCVPMEQPDYTEYCTVQPGDDEDHGRYYIAIMTDEGSFTLGPFYPGRGVEMLDELIEPVRETRAGRPVADLLSSITRDPNIQYSIRDHLPSAIDDHCDTVVLGDWDDDDVPNFVDNCPETSNFCQWDGDGDGIGDACDDQP